MNTPLLRYYASETYGASCPDPTQSPVDPDVHLETDHACLEDALANNDHNELLRTGAGTPTKINTRGREVPISRHVAELMENWHRKYQAEMKKHGVYNGLFINYAPRDEQFRNGPPFYEVETGSGLKIVTTFPGDMLKTIRDQVHRLAEIPNEDNPLYDNEEQFRSRVVHRYLRSNHTLPTKELTDGAAADVLDREYFRHEHPGLTVQYVDIYGNLICESNAAVLANIQETARQTNRDVGITIGDSTLTGEATTSLTSGTDGRVLVYENAGHIDVVRKWKKGEDAATTTRESAYYQFGKPVELQAGLQIDFGNISSEELRTAQKEPVIL